MQINVTIFFLIRFKKHVHVDVEDILECKDCWVKYFCAGNCLAQKISTGKSNDTASISAGCELEKILFEFYIKLFYYAKIYLPEYFKVQTKEETLETKNTQINC